MMRRLTDILFAIILLILLSPIAILVSIAILMLSGGPVFFVQDRVGRGGSPFRLYKFRTMRSGHQGDDIPLTVGDDPRVTGIGSFLRRLRLDEIPQLLNILKSDMTIVGPRPEVPRYVEKYDDWMRDVLQFKPGLTDPAALEYRHETDLLSQSDDPEAAYIESVLPAKIRISLEYQSKRTIISDIRVVFRTAAVILGF